MSRNAAGGWKTKQGYHKRHLGDGQENVHRSVWEAANGPLDPAMVIHHVNGIKDDNRIENLSALTVRDHHRTHAGWVKDESGEWASKPCSKCGETKRLSLFHRKGESFAGHCKECKNAVDREYRHANDDKMREYRAANAERRNATSRQYHKDHKVFPIVCEHCGSEWLVAKQYAGKQRFCSLSCAGKHRQAALRGQSQWAIEQAKGRVA